MVRRAAAALLLLAAARAAAEAPRLLVVVSVDQMRADYLDPAARGFDRGFKTLAERGAVFSEARQDHVPTETGPGHAVMLTGEPPGVTGIIGNEWWDRALATGTYVVADSLHGLGPEHLLAYALGDALKARQVRSRVVSVSVKDRAAILMGGKRPDVAVWYDRKKGEFVTSSYYGTPPWLPAFNRRQKLSGRPLAGLSGEAVSEFVYTSSADAAVLALAVEGLLREDLGQDEAPDILAVSFSATDYIGHRHGPDGPEQAANLRRLDAIVGELIAVLDKRVGRARYALALTGDHGVAPLAESPAGQAMKIKRVMWDEFHAVLEKALQERRPAPERWIMGPYYPNIFLNRAQARRLGLDWQAFRREAAAVLETVPGVARAQVTDELKDDGPYTEVVRRSVLPGRSGDLLLRAEPGLVVTDRPKGTDHATPYDYDARVPLVFFGPRSKTGRIPGPVSVRDLAPTLGSLVDLDLPPPGPGKGRVLSEALAPAP